MSRSLIPWRRRAPAPARVEDNPFEVLHREMTSLFDGFFREFEQAFRGWPGLARGGGPALAPAVDVSETDDEVHIAVDLPGLTEKDVEVSIDDDVLVVRGEKKQEREEKKRNYHLLERSYGRFERQVELPGGLDLDRAGAKFKNGVLTVTLPKRPNAQSRRRTIEVREE